MSFWKNSTADLGTIKAGTKKKVVFEGLPNIPKITNIYAYCGCTTSSYNEKTRELVIVYNNGAISPQVQGPQSITKKVDVTYDTGITETLIIKATKIR